MTADYKSLIGSSHAFGLLQSDVASEQIGHAYLLDAPDRLAGRLTMLGFARLVLGDGAAMVDAISLPEPPKETLAVADIDGLVRDVCRRPSQGSHKFYLIDCAETMSALVQNKLLKTLEEPPQSVHIVLNCRAVYKLLPTVVSRCRRIEVRPFSLLDITQALGEVYGQGEQVTLAAALSRGSLTEADAFMRDKKKQTRFMTALDTLKTLKSSADVLEAATKILAQKDDCSETIDFLEAILRDVRVLQAGKPELVLLQSVLHDIETIAQSYSERAIEKIMPFFGKLRRRIQLNANKNSLVDELLFGMAEYRVKFK